MTYILMCAIVIGRKELAGKGTGRFLGCLKTVYRSIGLLFSIYLRNDVAAGEKKDKITASC